MGIWKGSWFFNHIGKVCWDLWENSQLFSKVAVPFYISISNDCELLLLHILAFRVVIVLDFGHSCKYIVVSHPVVLTYSSLITYMTYDKEHHFIIFWPSVSSLVMCVLMSLGHFLIMLLISLLLSLHSSLFILKNSSI